MTSLSSRRSGPGGPADRLLSWSKVREITDLSRSTAWRRQRAGDFPHAVQISPGRVGWWESEVNAWKLSRSPTPEPQPRRGVEVAHERRPMEPLSARPEPAPPKPPIVALASDTPAGSAASPVCKSSRRRPICEGQIAFEF